MKPQYLGDGVYASFDGYHINLAINHHTNHVIAIEQEVMESLIRYYEGCQKEIMEEYDMENNEMEAGDELPF